MRDFVEWSSQMKSINLYRGISVNQSDADAVIEDIKHKGLFQSSEANWGGFIWKNQINSDDLFLREELSRKDTELASKKVKTKDGYYTEYLEGYKSICFADKDGAVYYAKKHNYSRDKPVSILIEAELDLCSVAIDGRDFLYTAFSFLRTMPPEKLSKARSYLTAAFGEKIHRYINKVFQHEKSDTNAICDLIICDDDIKEAHSRNTYIINGRHGTHFKCAFFAKVPIPAEKIVKVEILTGSYHLPEPVFSISDFR